MSALAGLTHTVIAKKGRDLMRYDASDIQRQYWLQDQFSPGNVAYNIVSAFRFGPQLQVETLKTAFSLVMDAHPIFSSRLFFEDDRLLVEEVPENTPTLQVDNGVFQSEPDALNALRQFAATSFYLKRGPLVRAKLVSVADEAHFLAIVAHHSIIDLRTKDLLGQSISEAYNSLVSTAKPAFEICQFPYSEYAKWYRDWSSGDAGKKESDFWVAEYPNMASGFDFPCDFPRPSAPSLKGSSVPISGSADDLAELNAFCRQQVTKPYLVLLACYFLMLRKYIRDDIITIGIPLTNRVRPEHRESMGCYMNIVPLTVAVSDEMTFGMLLQSVRKAMLIAHRHQSLPFSRVVDAVNPPRDRSRNPIFQTLFTFEHPMMLSLNDVDVQRIEIHPGGAQLDFSMVLWMSDDGLRGHFEYSKDLFQETTATRLISHFKQLLSQVITRPEARLNDVSLMDDVEYDTIVRKWNDTEKAYPPGDGLHRLFERQVVKTPDAIALEMPGENSLTYRALNAQCNQLAHYLISLGVKKGSRVGVYMKRSLEMVVALYAIEKAGGVYVPLEPDFPNGRITQMIEDAEIEIVLNKSAWSFDGPENVSVISVDSISHTPGAQSEENPDVGVADKDDAYIIFTSGSTGRPKGVLNGHAGICNRIYWMQETFQLTQDDAVLQKTPFTFDVSVWEFFWPFMCGARLVVAPPDAHKDPTALCELIRNFKISTIHFVPSMLEAFLGSPAIDRANDSLKRIVCSGEAMTRPLQDRCLGMVSAELFNLYGPTEAAVDVTYWKCKKEETNASVPIGSAIANTRLYILDASLNPVPAGVPGELHIGGVQVAKGYVNRPDLTAERFIPDPFDASGQGRLYKTGDWARFRSDGNIEFIGRMDGQVKIHGLRIELDEINVAIMDAMTQIQQAVTVINTEGADSRLVAYLVLQPSTTVDEGELRQRLSQRLPMYMVPELFITIDNVPLSANGKLDRRRLPALDIKFQESASGQAAESETEMEIMKIWCELLHLDEVGTERHFFNVGGTSILAAHLVNRLNREFSLELAPVFVFRYSNIKSQARHVENNCRVSTIDLDAFQKRAEKMRKAKQRRRRR